MMPLQVLDLGETAHRLLISEQRGAVLAAVSRAIYLLSDSGEVLWLTTAESPRHPRCIRVSAPLPGLMVNSPFTVDKPGLLVIGRGITLDCRRASIWSPPTLPAGEVLPLTTLPERVRAVFAVLENLPSPTGLGTLLPEIRRVATGSRPRSSPMEVSSSLTLALPVVREMARACRTRDGEKVLSQAESLVGLGEGLTPSGDDFVGGLLFCLHWLSRLYSLPTIDWTNAIERSSDKTNPISFTVLSDLAEGQGVEPLYQWLGCILTYGSMETMGYHAARLVQIGHSSGWDLLSGALTGLLWTFA